MFRFLQKGSYMSRNKGLLIYLEALIHRGKACIKAARQLRSYASGGHRSYQCLTNVDKRLRNKCAIVCIGKNILFLGRESKRSSETSYACEREGNNFFNKVYSLLTSH